MPSSLIAAHCRHHRSAHRLEASCRGHHPTDDLTELRCLDAALAKVSHAQATLRHMDAEADEAGRRDAATDLVLASVAVHALTIVDAPRLDQVAALRASYRAKAERGLRRKARRAVPEE